MTFNSPLTVNQTIELLTNLVNENPTIGENQLTVKRELWEVQEFGSFFNVSEIDVINNTVVINQ
ncbi:hypothetical protein [uncultured Methanobrevibacter sp.]|uniref:hypothetical protein n=1 Tax=uncultured Methanobrevibacter sp. TaxID=253161 RepID=UPI0025E153CE|nr:hypothetical protein [uncultured Methanobrevibacter sp.]